MKSFLPNQKFRSELDKILSDKTSGSSKLLIKLNIFFLKHFTRLSRPKQIILFLKKYFESFQNIKSYLNQLESILKKKENPYRLFKEIKSGKNILYDSLFRNAFTYLKTKRTILTISNSQTVYEILKRFSREQKVKIIICESRPKLEGRILARRLSNLNLSVQVITEAQTAEFLPQCDCVLVGADCILKNQNAVNKIGSLQIAVLSKYFNKPFYVVADKSKFSSKINFYQNEEKPTEIWKNKPQKISVKNYYFERIPRQLITKIIYN